MSNSHYKVNNCFTIYKDSITIICLNFTFLWLWILLGIKSISERNSSSLILENRDGLAKDAAFIPESVCSYKLRF